MKANFKYILSAFILSCLILIIQGCGGCSGYGGFEPQITTSEYYIKVPSSSKILKVSYPVSNTILYPSDSTCLFNISNAYDLTTLFIETTGKRDTIVFKTSLSSRSFFYDSKCDEHSIGLSRTEAVVSYSTCDSIKQTVLNNSSYSPNNKHVIVFNIWP